MQKRSLTGKKKENRNGERKGKTGRMKKKAEEQISELKNTGPDFTLRLDLR